MQCKNRCSNNNIVLESTAIEVSGGVMLINIKPFQAYTNYKTYDLSVCLSFPETTGIEVVTLNDGANSYPLLDTNGQPVIASRMKGHSKYNIRFGAGGAVQGGSIPAHFTVCSELCPVKYSSNAAYQCVPVQGV